MPGKKRKAPTPLTKREDIIIIDDADDDDDEDRHFKASPGTQGGRWRECPLVKFSQKNTNSILSGPWTLPDFQIHALTVDAHRTMVLLTRHRQDRGISRLRLRQTPHTPL